jgi:non-specific serine/threonine protein kinase
MDVEHSLGPYRILGKLGEGGMGEVYRARDTRLGRDVAVKVLSQRLAADQTAVARFHREARAVAALSHPNILAIFDVGSSEGVAYAVMELLEGQTLRARLQGGALDAGHAVALGVQLARGLAAAHDRGVVHRDLKPENLFILKSGQLKILDFGLARHEARATGPSSLATLDDTTPGSVLGTVGYMSPEQVRGQATDHRTDVFAVGVVLFEMLAGRRLFAASSAADTMAAIVRDPVPDLSAVNPQVPISLTRIVTRCTEKDPAARFQSATDLAFALDGVSDSSHSSGVSPRHAAEAGKSIVVLPFEDLSAGRDNAFFADGLTDEIISDLSKIQGLRVISRNSSMQLKSRARDIPTIGRELQVQYVLDGSVRKADTRLRITAQLVDASTNAQVWSEKYNGTLDDVFEIQEQVSRAIALELKGKLTKEESQELGKRIIEDPRAYEYYLKARGEMLRFTGGGMQRALAHIEAGLSIIGENVTLLGAKGEAYWQLFNLGIVMDPAQLVKVTAIAGQIERLEPGSIHAARLRALVAVHSHDLPESMRRLRQVHAADPNDMFVGFAYAYICTQLGKPAPAMAVARRLQALDPLGVLSQMMLPVAQYMEGDITAALEGLARTYDMDPDSAATNLMYVQALAAAGRTSDAIAIIDKQERQRPSENWTSLATIFKLGLQGDETAITARLTPELRAWCAQDPQYALLLAEAYALAGGVDDAFAWLEKLTATGACPYTFVEHHDVFLARLRGEARWPPLMAHMRAMSNRVEV